jgi:hypothetical protein
LIDDLQTFGQHEQRDEEHQGAQELEGCSNGAIEALLRQVLGLFELGPEPKPGPLQGRPSKGLSVGVGAASSGPLLAISL